MEICAIDEQRYLTGGRWHLNTDLYKKLRPQVRGIMILFRSDNREQNCNAVDANDLIGPWLEDRYACTSKYFKFQIAFSKLLDCNSMWAVLARRNHLNSLTIFATPLFNFCALKVCHDSKKTLNPRRRPTTQRAKGFSFWNAYI